MSAELFLEIGTEEIPARFVGPALESLSELLGKALENARIGFDAVRTLGSPRRLVAVVAGVADSQADHESVRTGPSVQAAFDAQGQPTKAARGFARSQGIDVSDLQTVETDKGAYVAARRLETGRPTGEVLGEILPDVILSIPFPKSMRWADLEIRFARPIHWIAAVLGGRVLGFTVGGTASGNQSRGNRFTSPEYFEAAGFEDYADKMKQRGLIVDPGERREIVRAQAAKAAEEAGGRIHQDEDLLDQVTFLTESPHAILGSFDRRYLELPRDVLITVMKSHQKYFSVEDAGGNLLPHFVTLADIRPRDPDVVARGNEKVLRARLVAVPRSSGGKSSRL